MNDRRDDKRTTKPDREAEQTLDSIELTQAEAESAELSEAGAESGTVDSVDLDAGPDATIELDCGQGPPKPADFDLVDAPPDASAVEATPQATVDKIPADDPATMHTLDSVDADSFAEEIADGDPGATLDSVDGIDSSDPGATLDSVDGIDVSDAGGLPEDALRTLDSVELSDDQLTRHVTQIWGDELDDARPMQTVKSPTVEMSGGKSTLVIQSRAFRDQEERLTPVSEGGADYDLLNLLGEGGMGVVYAARQASIDRNVAIKMLKRDTAADERQREKFLSEAVITGELDHPNIVPIYDLGTDHHGALFYSMKCVQGTPWEKRLAELSLDENIEILMKVADAVAFAHSRGILHRDLKPENVMLGEYGEVLVMDWGLALPTSTFRKSHNVASTNSMGGTPAYMAPEMALGPIGRIGFASDVYLLGAILFECVTGKTPHAGSDVRSTLRAAAKNEIRATEQQGELMEVALRAMATDPEDRFATVPQFQEAIRDYRAHSESILLTQRSEAERQQALEANDYQLFAQSQFGFREALHLWQDNQRAREGLNRVRLDHARCALQRNDFDLGISLLDPERADHQPLLQELRSAQQENEARRRRLQVARRVTAGLVALILVLVSFGFAAVYSQWQKAELARADAVQAQAAAERAAKQEERAKGLALVAKAEAEEAAEQQRIARVAEERAKQRAQTAQADAEDAARRESIARGKEAEAREEAEYQAYVASIGLAAESIEENAFEAAGVLLDAYRTDAPPWEWRRLQYLCQQHVDFVDAGTPIEAIDVSEDGQTLVAGGWQGVAQVWRMGVDGPPTQLEHGPDSFVYAVALSPDGTRVATGSSDAAGGFLRIWDAATGDLLQRLPGHRQAVVSVCFSRDGRWLLSSSFDHTARLWDVAKGEQVQEFSGHTWWVWSAAFSPDEKQIVTASQDGTVMVWSTETGKPVGQPFTGHREAGSQTPVYCAAFSPDGLLVASGGLDNRILLWEPAAIEPFDFAAAVAGGSVPPPAMKALEGHKAAVRGLVFSGDGKRLLSGGQDNLLIVWDLESLRAVKSLRGHDGWVRSCRLVQGDTSAVSGSHDGMVKFWDIAGYQESRVLQARTLDLHADAVLHAAFSSDSRGVVTASRDRTAIRWDATTGTALMHFRQGHDLTTTRAVFFPDGERLLTTAIDNTARVWDVITGAELLSLRMPRTGLQGAAAISRDGKWIVTGSDRLRIQDQEDAWAVQVFDAATGQCVHRLAEHRAPVSAVACSPDGQYVFSGDVQGVGILWDRESGRRVFEIHEDIQITAVAFSPEGTRLWVANNYNAVRSWSVPEGKEMVAETFLHPAGVASMSLSADGRRMLTSCRDGHVRLWEVADQQLIRELELRGGPATMAQNLRFAMKQMNIDEPRLSESCEVPLAILRGLLAQRVDPTEDVVAKLAEALETTSEALWRFVPEVAISPDGTQAITISATDRIVRLWSLPDGVEQRFPSEDQRPGPLLDLARGAHRGLVWTAVFSPDGQRVATVGGDSARLWNLARDVSESQREMMAFSPHGAVAWAEFSPDERWIATGSWDTSARIWDAATGQVIAQLGRTAEAPDRGHQGRVNSVCFSSDGQRLVTASDDGTACLWDCRDWSLLSTLRGHAGGVVCAVFSPDAQQVLTCSRDKTARLWDAHSGIEQAVLRGHQWSVLQGAFSPDGRWIATAGADNTAILWRLDPEHPPEIARRLIGHTAAVTSVAFSPGDPTMRILTGSEDYSAILWDVDTGRELLSLKGHTREVTSVAFSPDGSNVLTASRDGTAIVWLAMPRSGGEDLAEAERDRTVEPR